MASLTPTETPTEEPPGNETITLTSEIVSAYVGNNPVSMTDLPDLIETVYGRLNRVGALVAPEPEQQPTVLMKRSVKKESITCLECGKAQKMLKSHLATARELTPETYREKWRLPDEYPMVAPEYAEKRRDLAKKIGLGRKPGAAASKRKPRSGKKA